MTVLEPAGATTVDLVFPLDGKLLPRDHAQQLQQALCARFPWLNVDDQTGIHPIKLVPGSESLALLSGRSRLLLRAQRRRVEELRALAGVDLDVAGYRLSLGTPHVRELLPHATLYAYKVAADSADEVSFMATVDRELAQLDIGGQRVCGKRQRLMASGAVLEAFSLMLHALPPQQSMRLQQHGLGRQRLLGCGIFVPHKSAAAV